ncbi:MAG: methionine--tRNA ligase subunit beta [Nanoarchaeota archaeon]|nr:methionine--tRNA ligase subunit beta [Nanoarchaeota archaeon]
MELISYGDFEKLEMRVGRVLSAERIPKTEKLYKLQVDLGEKKVQIVSSLVPYYSEQELLGKSIVVLANLQPTKFGGERSEGMLLCAETEDGKTCVLLTTEKEIPVGVRVT